MTTEASNPPSGLRASLSLQSDQDFLEEQAHAMRAGVYELLSLLLARRPAAETLQRLRTMDEVDTSDGQMAMGWELMRQASLKHDDESIGDEHFELFVGLGRGELVPFASWYLTGFLMEKPLALLRRDLDALGIERQSEVMESEDHIAALCDAMALIIRDSGAIPLSEQRRFFTDHVAPWAGRLFDDMQQAGKAHFYRSVGFFGAGFLAFEAQLLGMET